MHAIKYFLSGETRSVPSNRIHTYLLTCHSLQRNGITVHIPTDAPLKMKVCGKEYEQSFFFFFSSFLTHTLPVNMHANSFSLWACIADKHHMHKLEQSNTWINWNVRANLDRSFAKLSRSRSLQVGTLPFWSMNLHVNLEWSLVQQVCLILTVPSLTVRMRGIWCSFLAQATFM